jgi:putative NADPH-quinone reductase
MGEHASIEHNQVMTKILGIGGSPRKGGNSDVLLKHILMGAKKGNVPTERVQLRDYHYQSCIGCERCRKDGICKGIHDGMHLLYPKVREASGLVLVSPTHNYNITALMKAFIDRLYCFYIFTDDRPRNWSSRLGNQGRKALLAAVCEQPDPNDYRLRLWDMLFRANCLSLAYLIRQRSQSILWYWKRRKSLEENSLARSGGSKGSPTRGRGINGHWDGLF